MPDYVVKVLGSTETLKKLERAIQQTEELGFTAVSVSAGRVGGKRGNLLTLRRAQPKGSVTLQVIDDGKDEEEQTDRLNEASEGGTVVSFGGVYVGGALKNMAMIRA